MKRFSTIRFLDPVGKLTFFGIQICSDKHDSFSAVPKFPRHDPSAESTQKPPILYIREKGDSSRPDVLLADFPAFFADAPSLRGKPNKKAEKGRSGTAVRLHSGTCKMLP